MITIRSILKVSSVSLPPGCSILSSNSLPFKCLQKSVLWGSIHRSTGSTTWSIFPVSMPTTIQWHISAMTSSKNVRQIFEFEESGYDYSYSHNFYQYKSFCHFTSLSGKVCVCVCVCVLSIYILYFYKVGWGTDNGLRSCAKQVCNACPQGACNLMERIGEYLEKHTRTTGKWNSQMQKSTMKMKCIYDEKTLGKVKFKKGRFRNWWKERKERSALYE